MSTRIKNGLLQIVKALKFEKQTLLPIPENRVVEVISDEGTAGKAYITVMAGAGNAVPTRKEILLFEAGQIPVVLDNATQIPIVLDALIANVADAKEDYAAADVGTAADIATALNAITVKVNLIKDALVTAGIMADPA